MSKKTNTMKPIIRKSDIALSADQVPIMETLVEKWRLMRGRLIEAQRNYERERHTVGAYAAECADKLKIDLETDYVFNPDALKFVDRQQPEEPKA